ncbi:MAG: hypothetical protein KGS61_06650 [Verrucomicrobia bacterium]|nr:hypothetical protein [Verrucomicrobiota bacterium]
MSPRTYKIALLALAIALLVGVGFTQSHLNRDRTAMGLTRIQPLENAPPVLAFTTVALGGFRGLIANALWVRMMDLQDSDKYFEMVQLADWITKLQPHLTTVWIVQAWNMAYNISVKFKESAPGQFPDRWRWVQAGIELLRDQALRYNPKEPLLYRELAGFFFHKIGQDLDDAHFYYKKQWIDAMTTVLGGGRPNWDELLRPQTAEAKHRVQVLEQTYKLDPREMKRVDDTYGPLDWRLPETQAIYWAMLGMEKSTGDLMPLRRMIYQAMQLAFQRGRLIVAKDAHTLMFAPNLDIIPKVNESYEVMLKQEQMEKENIRNAHKNFLKDAVYFLYEHNRLAEAAYWFKYLCKRFPTSPLLYADNKSLPGTLTLDEYALRRVTEDVSETSHTRVTSAIEGPIQQSYLALAMGSDADAENFMLFARRVYQNFEAKIPTKAEVRVGMPKFKDLQNEVLTRLLDPRQSPLGPELMAVLRTRLDLPTPTNAPPTTAAPR